MSDNKTFHYRPNHCRSLSLTQVEEAMLLHEAGWSNVAIGKKLGRHHSNIQRLLKKMDCSSVNKYMKNQESSTTGRVHRVSGSRVPESAARPMCAEQKADMDELLNKVARLEQELEEARLRADLYDEIINVAEKKFDIQIRKKAGTKR